ncbi:hypothetical protein B0H13DRAFT_1850396 [Mycena leptocephala]|nr:hypothetical protein B0H13DRAFT_1850396 [Mycena leptocephala]
MGPTDQTWLFLLAHLRYLRICYVKGLLAGASPPPLKEHGAVKWSTDPSQTAGTYLRNLLPDQGGVFRQLQARSTETVRKHIGGSARNLLPEQGEVFRQFFETSKKHRDRQKTHRRFRAELLRQVRSTETIRKHVGGSARNILPEQGKVFRQLRPVSRQARSTETIRKHVGGSARNVLPEQGKVFRQLRPVSRQARSTETVRKHIGGSAQNVLPEQGGIFTVFSGSWTRGLWYRDNFYLAQWVVREKHPQVLSGTGPNRPPRPPPKKQCRLVSQQAKHQDDISYGRRCRRPPQMVGGGAGDLRRWLEEVAETSMKWWPEVAKVAEVAEATSVTSALCSSYLRQTSART